MDWALASYRAAPFHKHGSEYTANGVDISQVGADPAAGEVFEVGRAKATTKKFNVVVVLDVHDQPHVYSAYPVP